MENERFIRRNFEARPMPIETAILGNDGKLFRNDFYNYYIEDFDKLFNGSVQIRSFLHHKILTVLESRFGTAGLALNDGLIG